MQCLAKNADDRPSSAAILVDALTTHRHESLPDHARAKSPRVTASKSLTLRRGVIAAFVLVALAGGIGATVRALRARGPTAPNGSVVWVNSAGYDDYMRGRVKVAVENRQENEEAIRYLRQAVAADPNLAPAYAELSRAYSIRAFYFAPDSEKQRLIEDAQIAVERSLNLSPDLAEGWFARGLMLWTPGRRFPHDQAINAYRRALSFNPKLDEAHHQLALVLLHVGLFDEAWTHLDSALAINPANTLARFRYGVISMYRGDYAQAEAWFRSTPLERNPSLKGFQEATALFRLGRSDSASAMISRFLADNPKDEGGVGYSVRAMIAAKEESRATADSAIDRAVELGGGFGHFHHTAFNIAVAETLLGRKSKAIEWLERAADNGYPCYPLFASDTELAPLRSEPRFISLLERTKREMDRYRVVLNAR